jgi:hypothetical protein
MGKFNGVKCDICGGIGELNQALEPPDGWVTILIHGPNGGPKIACKPDCVGKWSRERKRAVKEFTATPEPELV